MHSSTLDALLLICCFPLVFSISTPQNWDGFPNRSTPPKKRATTSSLTQASTTTSSTSSSTSPQVFAHYMLVTRPANGNYTTDISLAAAAGISAFAVNYGGQDVDFNVQTGYLNDFYTQVADLLTAAPSLDFKLFISVDLTSVTDASMVVSLYNQFASSPAQLLIDGKPVLSTFQTENPAWNWQTDVIDKLSTAPYFLPGTLSTTVAGALIPASSEGLNTNVITDGDKGWTLPAAAPGLFSWLHPTASMETEHINNIGYSQAQSLNISWMAPVSPWFFKRLSADENWAHGQDDGIFIDRFTSLLNLPIPPRFIELTTWNDFGESTYFGPAETTLDPYYDALDHSAFLTMAKPFISAFKSSQNVSIAQDEEDVFFFYRTQPALTLGFDEASSPAGDLPLPMNATEWKDEVFVVGMLNQSAKVTLNTGGMVHAITLEAGVNKVGLPWDFGAQSLDITFGNGTVKVKEGGVPIVTQAKWYTGNVVAA